MDGRTGKSYPAAGIAPAFVIVGVGRSGTTLLQAMLNAHPQMGVPPEIHYIRRYLFGQTLVRKKSPAQQMAHLMADRYITRLAIPKEQWRQWAALPLTGDWRTHWLTLMIAYLQKQSGKRLIGLKEPRAIEWLVSFHRLFPQTRILHIVRDPRDVLLSKLRAGWSRHHSVYRHIAVHAYQLAMGQWAAQQQVPVLTVPYEALVTSPEQQLTRICQFLGVDYAPEMLSYYTSAEQLIHSDEVEWKQNVTRPLLPENIGKWQTQLSQSNVYLVQRVLKPYFAEFGWPISSTNVGGFQKIVLNRLCDGIKIAAKVRTRYQQWVCQKQAH